MYIKYNKKKPLIFKFLTAGAFNSKSLSESSAHTILLLRRLHDVSFKGLYLRVTNRWRFTLLSLSDCDKSETLRLFLLLL